MNEPVFSATQYASDLTDAEWELLAPMIPPPPPDERTVPMRAILNGIFYKLRAGCSWRMLPSDLPKWRSVYEYFQRFQCTGLWEKLNHTLRDQVRLSVGKQTTPTAAIIDSQSVKGTEKRGFAATPRGFHLVKHRWKVERTFAWLGRNRQLSKEYDLKVAHSEAWIWLAMIRLMLRRLKSPAKIGYDSGMIKQKVQSQ